MKKLTPAFGMGMRVGLAAVGLLLLQACQSVPETHVGTERIEGAFVATDGKLYMIGSLRTAQFDATPFQAYRELANSPLQSALVCSRLNYRIDTRGLEVSKEVHGSYAMLFRADAVSQAQVQQFGLQRLDIADHRDGAVALPDAYLKAADPVCGLPSTGGRYYSVVFEADGRWVTLPKTPELMAKSRFPTPLLARLEVNRAAGPLISPLDVVGGVVGVAAIPVFLVSLPFLGPDHWK